MIPVLRPYQIAANDKTVEAARRGARVIIKQGSCGSGKTNEACDLIRRALAKDSSVLAIVHLRKLVTQFSERLREFEISHGVIMSGEERDHSSAKVQVASRDTLQAASSEHGYGWLPPARLVIVDEGRHALAPAYRKLLYHYEQQGAIIVCLDATPAAPDGTGMGPWAQAMVVSAKTTELIRDGWLVPMKCFAPDRKMYRGKVRRGIAGDLVSAWKEFAENRPTVLFTSRVVHSQDAVLAFKASGIPAAHVDADTPDEERDAIFDLLKDGSIKVVSNVGIIREGVDLPFLGCVQYYMDPGGRTGFIQGSTRCMRPFPGKEYGILIDHAGAVYRHGFPDEDTEWTLVGNVDADYKKMHDDGLTPKARYCAKCKLVYHSQLACPQCGRMPVTPPKSIFDAPPVEVSDELLTEADRQQKTDYNASREAKVQHWLRCLAVAVNRNDGTFSQACAIYRQKYKEFPGDSFPCIPPRHSWKRAITSVFPNSFRRKKQQA
jgi:superfamily II DNA or RNA helicase